MSRQLTPEEREIIKETERLGAEQAEKETAAKTRGSALKSGLTFAVIFFVMVFLGYLILKWAS